MAANIRVRGACWLSVVVYPGMVHETLSIGEECSSSISQTFEVPLAAAYFRAFWPRFALIHEDVGRCDYLVKSMAALGSGTSVPLSEKKARLAGKKFAAQADLDGDGYLSTKEIEAMNKAADMEGHKRTLDELVAFHDVNDDGAVSIDEIVESWAMFGAAGAKVRKMMKEQQGRPDL